MCVCAYTYVHIHTERETERERESILYELACSVLSSSTSVGVKADEHRKRRLCILNPEVAFKR